jgi:voltage-gated potassium channel
MRHAQRFSALLKYSVLLRLFLIMIAIMAVMGITIHFVEPDTYPSVYDGIWWAFITAATIGYGDYIPESVYGRLTAVVLVLIGGGMMTAYMTSLSSAATSMQNELKQGTLPYTKNNHFLVIGWNTRSRRLISVLRETNPDSDIVLIDQTVTEHPLPDLNIHFIKGDPGQDEALQKANVKTASTVFITADVNITENGADMKSILSLLAVKGLNPSARCIVEILTPEQIDHCARAGADKVIETASLTSTAMFNTVKDHR